MKGTWFKEFLSMFISAFLNKDHVHKQVPKREPDTDKSAMTSVLVALGTLEEVNVEDKLEEDDKFFYWKKGQLFQLTPYFDTKEFECQCSLETCTDQKISKSLVSRLNLVRMEIKEPLKITSGFRCKEHQQEIRDSGQSTVVAVKTSTHELGEAADVRTENLSHKELLEHLESHFDSIGLANTFYHVDLRTGRRRWNY